MASRSFWSEVWRGVRRQGPPWQPDLAALRVQHFNEAADVLDGIGRKLECFDDADSQRQAQGSFSCARALRIYVAASTGNTTLPTA
jgi:hypothetical protein